MLKNNFYFFSINVVDSAEELMNKGNTIKILLIIIADKAPLGSNGIFFVSLRYTESVVKIECAGISIGV